MKKPFFPPAVSAIARLALVASLVACRQPGIEGKWVEPVPGMAGQVQGMHLEKGGKASSINMATLQYDRWERHGDTLVLSGKSIGNHTTIAFTEAFSIDTLTGDTLKLKKGALIRQYHRQP